MFFCGLAFFVAAFLFLSYALSPPDPSSNTGVWYFIAAIIGGLIFGVSLYKFYFFGLFMLSFGAGALVGVVIVTNYSINFYQDWMKYTAYAGFGLVMALLVLSIEKPLLIVATSVYGSYTTFVGVGYLTGIKYADNIVRALTSKFSEFIGDARSLLSIFATLVLAILGIIIQVKFSLFKEENLKYEHRTYKQVNLDEVKKRGQHPTPGEER